MDMLWVGETIENRVSIQRMLMMMKGIMRTGISVHYGDTSTTSDDQFDDMDTDDDAQLSQSERGQEDIVPGETDTSPGTPEDLADDK